MMIVAVPLILAACVLISVGRAKVRGARRMEATPGRRRRGKMLGWTLVFVGVLFMICGVVTW